MKRSGPALPPAQPTIPLLMIGPWQPQFGSCFGQARFPSGTTPAGQSPLTTRGGAAPLPPQLIRPCTRKSFSERYSSPPHWWVAANLGRRSRSAMWRRPHWRAPCVVPRVCSARARRGEALQRGGAPHELDARRRVLGKQPQPQRVLLAAASRMQPQADHGRGGHRSHCGLRSRCHRLRRGRRRRRDGGGRLGMLGRHDGRIGGRRSRWRRPVRALGRVEEGDDDDGGDEGRDLERGTRAPRTARLGRREQVLAAHQSERRRVVDANTAR